MEITKDTIRAYALKNAIHYKGKANQGAVISGLFAEGLEKSEVKDYSGKIKEVLDEVNALSLDEQKKEFENLKDYISEREVREGLPELPNVDSKNGVVMRFAPSPSGALHIGHAITACLSYDYVRKYGGKFIFRVEDTNPDNIYPEAYDLLKEDSQWLFEDNAFYVIQSDRMDLYYSYAVSLIEKSSAYVCTCSGDDFREFSKNKKSCPCHSKSVEENILDWEKMVSKDSKNNFKQGEAILRFKTPEDVGGMAHKNPAMRDFPLARINESEHPRKGNEYRVWPLMNLSVSIDDIEMGITHVIRAKEHRDNAERQKMVFKVFGKEYPWAGFLGRIHLKGMRLSSSEITQGVKEGNYSGWDDEKLPTVSALRKKGYKPEAFWKMSEHIGLSEVDKTLSEKDFFELLKIFNKG
jgi:glutamyl-tRNA synthetase